MKLTESLMPGKKAGEHSNTSDNSSPLNKSRRGMSPSGRKNLNNSGLGGSPSLSPVKKSTFRQGKEEEKGLSSPTSVTM